MLVLRPIGRASSRNLKLVREPQLENVEIANICKQSELNLGDLDAYILSGGCIFPVERVTYGDKRRGSYETAAKMKQ